MAEKINSSTEPKPGLTAQQWAWQFLRRNPEYLSAFEMLSTLSQKQFEQLKFLIARDQDSLLSEDFLDEKIIRTLDLRFFDSRREEMLDETGGETVGMYLDQISDSPSLDRNLLPKVSNKFRLDYYCLSQWINPIKFLDFDAQTAAKLWVYKPFLEFGLAKAPWLEHIEGVNLDSFENSKRSTRSKNFKKNPLMLRGADGTLFMRSPTIFGRDYKTPKLDISQVDVRIDLGMPLEFQIRQVKEQLVQHRKLLQSAGLLDKPLRQVDRNGIYQEYILILDRLNDGANPVSLTLELDDQVFEKVERWVKKDNSDAIPVKSIRNRAKPTARYEELTAPVRQKIVRALRLRDSGYKTLAFL